MHKVAGNMAEVELRSTLWLFVTTDFILWTHCSTGVNGIMFSGKEMWFLHATLSRIGWYWNKWNCNGRLCYVRHPMKLCGQYIHKSSSMYQLVSETELKITTVHRTMSSQNLNLSGWIFALLVILMSNIEPEMSSCYFKACVYNSLLSKLLHIPSPPLILDVSEQ